MICVCKKMTSLDILKKSFMNYNYWTGLANAWLGFKMSYYVSDHIQSGTLFEKKKIVD